MSTPTRSALNPPPPPLEFAQPHDKHRTVNRWLKTVALVLGILLMAFSLYVGAEVVYKWIQLQNALTEFGADMGTVPAVEPFDPGAGEYEGEAPAGSLEAELGPFDPSYPEECYNPGGGEVCAPGGEDGFPGGN